MRHIYADRGCHGRLWTGSRGGWLVRLCTRLIESRGDVAAAAGACKAQRADQLRGVGCQGGHDERHEESRDACTRARQGVSRCSRLGVGQRRCRRTCPTCPAGIRPLPENTVTAPCHPPAQRQCISGAWTRHCAHDNTRGEHMWPVCTHPSYEQKTPPLRQRGRQTARRWRSQPQSWRPPPAAPERQFDDGCEVGWESR